MGGGKSKVAIDVFNTRKSLGDVGCSLITCPPIVCQHWANEVHKHSNRSVTIIDGTPNEKFQLFISAQTDFIVVSHAWLTRLFSDVQNKTINEEIVITAIQRFDCLIIDEVHRLKEPESKGFQAYAKYFADIKYRYFLTGTPVGNNYLGVWAIYYLLDKGETYTASYNKFLNKWFDVFHIEKFNPKTRRTIRIPMYNLNKSRKDDFFERFWSKAIRWEENELTDLPEKNYLVIPLGMTASQRKEYQLALKQHLGDGDSPLWDLMRITGGATDTLKASRQVSTKLEALAGIIDEVCIENNQQLIVWVYLVDEGRAIAEFLSKRYKNIVYGEMRAEVTKTQKNKSLDGWRTGKTQILIANVDSIGIGIDLYEASTDVFYSNSPSYIARRQAEKRIHRHGQTKTCLHIDLVCKDTVDEIILDNLNNAAQGFAELSRDQMWTKIQKSYK
jgi:SNF2 family DNA or RNA helicase